MPKKPTYLLSADFVKLLGLALLTADNDPARPALNRVLLDITKDGAAVASTDKHSIFTHKLIMEVTEEEKLQLSPF